MYQTTLNYENYREHDLTLKIDGEVPVVIRLNSDQAEALCNELTFRAADSNLYNKDGTFEIAGHKYDMSAGVWASVRRVLEEWYEVYFREFISPSLFGDSTVVPPMAARH